MDFIHIISSIVCFLICFRLRAKYLTPLYAAQGPEQFFMYGITEICSMNYILEMDRLSYHNYTEFQVSNSTCPITEGFFFVKTDNQTYFTNASFPKLTYSTYPDTGYMPLLVSLYTIDPPKYILYADQYQLKHRISDSWISHASMIMSRDPQIGVVFGADTIYNGKRVGISLAFVRESVLRELLYYTNCTSESIPPLLALSLASIEFRKFKIEFLIDQNVVPRSYHNTDGLMPIRFQECPIIHSNSPNPRFALLLPHFIREYTEKHLKEFAKQDISPVYYVIHQNRNRISIDFNKLRTIVQQPVYRIWEYNWNSFFFLTSYIPSLFNVDFVFHYDDDIYPNPKDAHRFILNLLNNRDRIVGNNPGIMNLPICGFNPQPKMVPCRGYDHVAVPTIYRPSHSKLNARNRPYTYAGGEDIGLATTANKLCGTEAFLFRMNLTQFQNDGKNHQSDSEIHEVYKKEGHLNRNLYFDVYCHYIQGGYQPKCWTNWSLPLNRFKNAIYHHTAIF